MKPRKGAVQLVLLWAFAAAVLAGCAGPPALVGAPGMAVGLPLQEESLEAESEAQETAPEELCVYVCGSVNRPGVYDLPPGARAADALEAAGGFSPDADRESRNLAQPVSDGEQLRIPSVREAAWEQEVLRTASSGLVNLNTADAAELMSLKGIGEVRAAAIIDYREKNGPFGSVEEITQVSGIGEAALEKIRDRITV